MDRFVCVVIESPYAGNVRLNEAYARACMRDSLARGEAPYASHLLYTQPGVLDDTIPEERAWGIAAGFAWRAAAQRTVVYTDLGISGGMHAGIADAERRGCPVEYRDLGPVRMAEIRDAVDREIERECDIRDALEMAE